MAFDKQALSQAVARHGRVARVVIAAVAGSSPREVGAAMLVWDGGQSGTIGGGALEYEAAAQALTRNGLTRHALGPDLGQCCGGVVQLLTEHYDADRLKALPRGAVIARPVAGASNMPLAVKRRLDHARARGETPPAELVQGWMIEPLQQTHRPVWIWGAGHVGRALINVLAPLPQMQLTWIDTHASRFPDTVPAGVAPVPAANPAALVPHAPENAIHVIATYSHALDLALCDAALRRGFAFCGVIGSASKWARFRKRLAVLGHGQAAIAEITCPIGRPGLGKHPQAIAIGVATQIMMCETEGVQACSPHFSASSG